MNEKIVCVKTSLLYPYAIYDGFYEWNSTVYARILSKKETKLRSWLEQNDEYRQIIPYCIIKNYETGKILTYNRAGSESRLNGQWSIGFGGHWKDGEEIFQCIFRELNEELAIPVYTDINPLGFVACNLTEVDRVHFGIVFLVRVDNEPIIRSEANTARWKSIKNLTPNDFESWSNLIIAAHKNAGDICAADE